MDRGLYWSGQNRAESHSQYSIGIFKTLFTIWQQYFPAWKITPSSSHLLLYAWYIIFIQFGHSQKNPILGHAYWQQKIHSIVSTIHFQHFWTLNKIIWFFFQHAAEVEKKQNASEVQKSMGSVIQYGITIQVSPSNFFLKIQLASIGF